MSLINRMLRDLSSRQPGTGNVMGGIQLPHEARPRGGAMGRLLALVVLVVGFTGVFWVVFGPKPVKIPQPRGLPAGTTLADGAASATGAPAGEPAHLKMDTELSSAPATASAPATEAPAPGATSTPPAPAPTPAPAVKPRQAAAPKAATTKPAATSTAANPASAAERYAAARRALSRGDEVAAGAALEDALLADPNLHNAREDLGNLRLRQGQLDDAERVARVGLELEPGNVGYRRLLARVLLARSEPANALALLESGVPAVERDTEYHALLASAYQRLNRHEEASRAYRELARVQPNEANWWAGYAMSRDALGDVPAALAAYAQARQLGGLAPRVLEHINRRTAALQAAG